MKKIKLINKVLISISLLINTICLILTLLGKYNSNILICLCYYGMVFVPSICRQLKLKITDIIELIYLLFVILASLFGSILHFYGLIYWFDSFTHYISGMLTALLGFILLNRFKKLDSNNYAFNVTYIIFVSLAVAALWEIFEFTADNILHGDAQRVLETGVTDTMKDIICAFLGSILVSISYLYEYMNNKKLVITNFIKSLK